MQKLEGVVWGKDVFGGLWGGERMEGLVLVFLCVEPMTIGLHSDCA